MLSLALDIEPRWFQRSFLGLAFGVLLFIPIDLFHLSVGIKTDPSSYKFSVSSLTGALNSHSIQPLAFYETVIQKSNLFGSPASEGGLSVFKSSIADGVKDFRVKGVIILNEPEAILEDARAQKSIFVKKGDKIGELTVKEIREDSVVLGYLGEEKELRIQ